MTIDPDPNAVQHDVPAAPARGINGAPSLTDALINAYYQRDADAIRRIAGQVEQRLAALERPREAS